MTETLSILPLLTIQLFDNSEAYIGFLKKNRVDKLPIGAVGFMKGDVEFVVAIPSYYYESGKIEHKFFPAIARHELAEYRSTSENPHYDGLIAEYTFIIKNFGKDELTIYHNNMCNLFGGNNSLRAKAYEAVDLMRS